MDKPSLAICTPSGRLPSWSYAFCLARMVGCIKSFSRATVQIELGYATDAARIRLVDFTKREGYSHILFLDDDMSFPGDTADRLIAHDKDIVGANYTSRVFPVRPLAVKDSKHHASRGRSGLEKVDIVPTGIMMVRMSVFERLPLPWFQTTFQPESPLDPMSDDVYFCHLARKHGFDVWVDHDLSMEIGHAGTIEFGHMMAPGAEEETKSLIERAKEQAA